MTKASGGREAVHAGHEKVDDREIETAGFQSFQPMLSQAIAYRGQPITLVAADTLEAAIEAASRVKATYSAQPASVTLDAPGTEIINQADTPLKNFIPEVIAGDADTAFAEAPVKIDAAKRPSRSARILAAKSIACAPRGDARLLKRADPRQPAVVLPGCADRALVAGVHGRDDEAVGAAGWSARARRRSAIKQRLGRR